MNHFNVLSSVLKSRKILLYGTGVWCRRLLEGLEDIVSVVGILDRDRGDGEIQGVPILRWNNIHPGTADAVIIASRQQFYKEIYTRICDECFKLSLDIYSADGQNLKAKYDTPAVSIENALYYAKTKEELVKRVESYSAISFDVFDTLIMRRALQPSDIFDLTDEKLRKRGVIIEGFCQSRRTAESRLWPVLPHATIDDIYDFIKSELHLDDETADLAKELELQCETENLVPRKTMVEVFNVSLRMGKRVSLISDMYYPSGILEEILKKLGIDGYDRLYVSCDYKTGKTENLFAEYKKDIGNSSALHIGDNKAADVIAPLQHGIDSFEVWSAYKMLENSSMSSILVYTRSKSDKLFLGQFIAEVLNDPFALHTYAGIINTHTLGQFCYFLAPAIILFMKGLYRLLDSGQFDTVLFSARDCYLFNRIYDLEIFHSKKENVRDVYFYASRKLALKAACADTYAITKLLGYQGKKNRDDIVLWLKKIYDIEDAGMETVIELSSHTRKNFLKYIKENNISMTQNSLFCDFISQGTVQCCLNELFACDLQGYYFGICNDSFKARYINGSGLFNYEKIDINTRNFLEKIFTSPENSVQDINSCGEFIFSPPDMNMRQIDGLNLLHENIIRALQEKASFFHADDQFSLVFSFAMMQSAFSAVLPHELNDLMSAPLKENLLDFYLPIEQMHFEG